MVARGLRVAFLVGELGGTEWNVVPGQAHDAFSIPPCAENVTHYDARNLAVALSVKAGCGVLGVAADWLEPGAALFVGWAVPLERNALSDPFGHDIPVPGVPTLESGGISKSRLGMYGVVKWVRMRMVW